MLPGTTPFFDQDDSPEGHLRRMIAGYSQPAPPPAAPPETSAPAISASPIATPDALPPIAPAIKSPSAAATRQSGEEAELQRLRSTGSGVEQFRTGKDAMGNPIPGKHGHPILGTIARIGDVALSSLFPTVAMNVPGTTFHHNVLENQQAARVEGDVGQQQEEAQTADVAAQAEQRLHPQVVPKTPKDQTYSQLLQTIDKKTGKPFTPEAAFARVNEIEQGAKNEQWEVVPGYTGPNGEPILVEKNSGRQRLATSVPGVKAKEPVKAPSDFETYYQRMLTDENLPDTAANRLQAQTKYDLATHAATIRGQDKTDDRMRDANAIARDTKETNKRNADETALHGAESDMDRLATAANALLKHPGLKSITGVRGAIPNLPGTDAADAEALLHTLTSQVGFGVLQNMRNQSKTGGALGAVSDNENKLLQNNLATLDKAQSLESIQKSLQDIIDYTTGAKDRMREAVTRTHGVTEIPKVPSSAVDLGAAPAGKPEGATGTLPDGTKIVVKKGRLVKQ